MKKINSYISKSWPAAVLFLAGILVNKFFDSGALIKIFKFNNYSRIGSLYNSGLEMMFFIAFAFLGAILGVFLANLIMELKLKNWFKSIIFFFLILLFFWVGMLIHNLDSQLDKSKQLMNNTEIIHPFISNQEYIKLKSDILQIDSKKSFDKTNNVIRKVANENQAKIK